MVFRTQLADSSFGAIAREFSLGVVSSRYINGGARNTSYLLTGSGKSFVATVLERKSYASAEAYGAFLHEIASEGIPTPRPIKTRADRWAYLVEGKPVIVTPFVEGVSTGSLNETELFDLGVLLGRVHESQVSYDVPPVFRIGSSDLSWLEKAGDDPFCRWALQQYARTADVVDEGGPCTLTHGDPFRDNIVVAPDGALILIDWEDAALDRPVFDLAQAVLAHCGGKGTDLDRMECLLTGYNSNHQAEISSLEEVLRAVTYSGLVVAYERYRRYLTGFASAAPYVSMWNLTESLSRYTFPP